MTNSTELYVQYLRQFLTPVKTDLGYLRPTVKKTENNMLTVTYKGRFKYANGVHAETRYTFDFYDVEMDEITTRYADIDDYMHMQVNNRL